MTEHQTIRFTLGETARQNVALHSYTGRIAFQLSNGVPGWVGQAARVCVNQQSAGPPELMDGLYSVGARESAGGKHLVG